MTVNLKKFIAQSSSFRVNFYLCVYEKNLDFHIIHSLRLSTVNGQQSSCFMSTDNSQQTTDSVHKSCTSDAYPRTVDRCPLSVDYFESQIRLADSLYKNYLPQYNFEEVKAAMEFFDSVQLSAISRQRWRLFNKKTDNENKLIAESRLLTAAKAHYYHAVGLTERDDIVGACEHYFIALEIMETETENLKNSESEKSCEPRAMSHEPFSKTEKSVNISEICGNEKTNHRLVQKKSEKAASHEL